MLNLLLRPINVDSLLIVLAIVAVIAIVFAVLIVLVSKLCFVKEDEKVKAVSEHLAGANCGGCGYAGCSDFAKALAEGKASINDCGATSNESKEEIAKVLNVPFSASAQVFAVVKCAGGNNAKDKFAYVGNKGCDYQSSFQGGRKFDPARFWLCRRHTVPQARKQGQEGTGGRALSARPRKRQGNAVASAERTKRRQPQPQCRRLCLPQVVRYAHGLAAISLHRNGKPCGFTTEIWRKRKDWRFARSVAMS
jgi:hypothetical protein